MTFLIKLYYSGKGARAGSVYLENTILNFCIIIIAQALNR
jgi:hypothetical protein